MSDREKINKNMMIKHSLKKTESQKQMKFFQYLRKEVDIGAGGTQKYVIKNGPNKGKIVGWYKQLLHFVYL